MFIFITHLFNRSLEPSLLKGWMEVERLLIHILKQWSLESKQNWAEWEKGYRILAKTFCLRYSELVGQYVLEIMFSVTIARLSHLLITLLYAIDTDTYLAWVWHITQYIVRLFIWNAVMKYGPWLIFRLRKNKHTLLFSVNDANSARMGNSQEASAGPTYCKYQTILKTRFIDKCID